MSLHKGRAEEAVNREEDGAPVAMLTHALLALVDVGERIVEKLDGIWGEVDKLRGPDV